MNFVHCPKIGRRLDTTDGFIPEIEGAYSRSRIPAEWSGSGVGPEPFQPVREPSGGGLRASEISGIHPGIQSEASRSRLPPGLAPPDSMAPPAPTRTNLDGPPGMNGEETPSRIGQHDEILNGVLGFMDTPER